MSYASLAFVFLALAGAVTLTCAVVARPTRGWWLRTLAVLAVLLLLTAVFDSLMIAADLFRFDEARLLGPHVLLAPIEDLAWPVASALALPALWVLLDRRPRPEGSR